LADYLKIPEVARRLDVSEPTVRRMVKGGKLPSVFIGGAYRVSEKDLEEYLESAKVTPGKAPRRSPSEPSLFNGQEEERRLRPWISYVSRRVEWCEEVVERTPAEEWNNPWLSLETAIQWAVYVGIESAALRELVNREVLPHADGLTDEADELRTLIDRFRAVEEQTDDRVRVMMEDAGLSEAQKRARLHLIQGERSA
jgi:excisionase family DNA binding protein